MQTSYPLVAERAFAGLLGDAGTKDIISRFNEEGDPIEFGIAVVAGTDPERQVLLPSGAGDTFMGITVHEHQQDSTLSGKTGIPGDGGKVGCLRSGRMWVNVEEAVNPDDNVYFRHTADTFSTIGYFRKDADTASADQLTNAQWISSTSGAGLALLQINFP